MRNELKIFFIWENGYSPSEADPAGYFGSEKKFHYLIGRSSFPNYSSVMTYLDQALVFGSEGQVASSLRKILPKSAQFFGQKQVSFLDLVQLEKVARECPATSILCPAAYTQVDKAEAVGERENCFSINAQAPKVLARVCSERGIPFLWYSTDYVFDGSGTRGWKEDDQPHPLNVYGQSKWEGEKNIQQMGGRYLILRTSWVLSSTGTNFIKTMLRLGAEKEELRIVSDQRGAPTSADDLAAGSLQALARAWDIEQKTGVFPSGIYHLTNGGETSWAELAERVFARARARGYSLKIQKVIPISSDEYITAARRPKNSRLCGEKATMIFGLTLGPWDVAIDSILDQMLPKL